MRPVSAGFLSAVRGSHRATFEARVVGAGQNGVDPDGTEIPILGGDVAADAEAEIRTTLDLTTDGTGRWPTSAGSLLAPYGNEIFVRRGIAYGNGVTEWVSLGYFRIYAPDQDDAPDGQIRVQARDRMSGIVDGRLPVPVQFPAAATNGSVVDQLVRDIYPAAVIEWDDDTETDLLGRAQIAEQDRYAFLHDLVTSNGKVWYWDHRGVLVLRTPPSVTSPGFDVSAGAGGVLVNLRRQLTREGTYNGVVATGEGPDTISPVRALAVDANPASPTYWDGPFGKVPRFYSSPFITTQLQAERAAVALLQRGLGLVSNVDLTAIPNPALEPRDVVRVTYPARSRSGSGRQETHVLEKITIPLTSEAAMTATTRAQQHVATAVLT